VALVCASRLEPSPHPLAGRQIRTLDELAHPPALVGIHVSPPLVQAPVQRNEVGSVLAQPFEEQVLYVAAQV
jgi:hypothetical protein